MMGIMPPHPAAMRLRLSAALAAGWVCLLLILGASSLFAQQYRYEHWTAEDTGLPQNIVRAVAQTPDGYLWIATLDGIARFDGVRFTTFNKSNTPQLLSNRFGQMVQDADGDLWMGTEDGELIRYARGRFSKAAVPGILRGITRDGAGDLWLLMENSLLRWDRERGEPVDGTPAQLHLRFVPFRWGNGCWARDSNGLHIFTQGRFLNLPEPEWLAGKQIYGLARDGDGILWVETIDGKQAFLAPNGSSVTLTDPEHPKPFAWRDTHGHIWHYHVGPRLTRFLDFDSVGEPTSLPMDHFMEDREGNVWLGTEGQGLYRLQEQSVRPFIGTPPLPAHNIYPILQDSSGAVWLGAWPSGLSRIDAGGHTTSYTVRDGLPNPLVSALATDHGGRLWVATHGGLVVFHEGRFTPPANLELPDHAFAEALAGAPDGTMWIGTTDGLLRYRDGRSELLTVRDGLAANDVKAILPDGAGGVWLGGYGGLTHLRDGHARRWTERAGLPSKNIRALYKDSEGVLWIGTYDGGLGRLQDGHLTRYSRADGLFSDGVFQILEDSHRNLWMSSNQGIYRVSKDELNALARGERDTITSASYGRSDGMLNAECNGGVSPAGIVARDGELWFPTQDGVAVVDPSRLRTNLQPPPVVIEAALLDGKPQPVDRSLRIASGRENLEIQYTALSFIHPEQIRFRYMLRGLDSTWVDAGTRRTAYYSHLPPGDYTFSVLAQNSDGIWNEQGKSLAISVLAPFYQTWWFTLLEALVAAGLVVLVARSRMRQAEQRQQRQKAFAQQMIASQESERQRIAAELHDSLGQRLIVINNLALLALRPRKDADAHTEALREITAEASLAIQETREISYDLRPFQLDRLGLTRAIQGLARSVASASGMAVTVESTDIDEAFPEALRINFYRILQESLNNAMKHAQASEVRVRVTRENGSITLSIQDNGVGFATGAAPAAASSKNGFGLTGMAERADLLGGTFYIHSSPGQGTTTTVEFQTGEHAQ